MAALIYDNVCRLQTKQYAGDEAILGLLTFSDDGEFLAPVMMPFRLICTSPTRTLRSIEDDGIEAVAFSPDNRMLATFSHSGIKVWNTYSGHLVTHYDVVETMAEAANLVFDRQGHLAFLTSKRAYIWRLADNAEVSMLEFDKNEVVFAARLTRAGKLNAYSHHYNRRGFSDISVVNLLPNRRIRKIEKTHVAGPWLSHDGSKALVLCKRPADYDIFSLRTLRQQCHIHLEETESFDQEPFSPASKYIVSTRMAIRDQEIVLRRSSTGNIHRVTNVGGQLSKICWSKRHRIVALVQMSANETLFVDPLTSEVIARTKGSSDEATTFSPCGRWFGSISTCRTERYNKIASGSILLTDLAPVMDRCHILI